MKITTPRRKFPTPLFVIELVDNLRQARKDKGLSRKDVALNTGLSYSCITQYELGQSYPAQDNYNKLAHFFQWKVW